MHEMTDIEEKQMQEILEKIKNTADFDPISQIAAIKNDILKELEESKFELYDLEDEDYDSIEFQFYEKSKDTIIDVIESTRILDDYEDVNINDVVDEIFTDFDLYSFSHEFAEEVIELRSEILKDDDFEILFKQVTDEVTNGEYCYRRDSLIDKQIYIKFVYLAEEKICGKENTDSINIWHIEQNDLKNEFNGRRSIKSLCRAEYDHFDLFLSKK